MRKVALRSFKLLALLAFILVALLQESGTISVRVLDQLDRMWYDARIQNLPLKGTNPDIVIVDIDEKSLAEIGRWPWGRDKLAQLATELLERQKVAVLGFDLVFAEPDTSSGLVHLQNLARGPLRTDAVFQKQVDSLRATLDFDALFAQAISGQPVVMGYYFTSDRQGDRIGQLPPPTLPPAQTPGGLISGLRWSGYGANLGKLIQAAPSAGFFNVIPDDDGVVRAVPLMTEFEGRFYESLSLAMFRVLLDKPTVDLVRTHDKTGAVGSQAQVVHAIALKDHDRVLTIPVDGRLAGWVPYRGSGGSKAGAFRYVSAADVLMGRLPVEALQSKLVILGSSAPGLQDLRATPVASTYAGVEIHANMLAAMMDGTHISKPDYAVGFNVVQIALIGGLILLAAPWLSAGRMLLLGFAAVGAVVGINTYFWQQYSLVFPVANVLALIVTLLVFQVGWEYLAEARSKRKLVALFGTYVQPELVAQMAKEPEQYSMQAQSVELTVMFCDMRGFTAMSETMQPESLQAFINDIFSRLTHVIRNECQGTIDKYMGDCIMAFWGAPVHNPQHAHLSILAATKMVEAVRRVNEYNKSRGLPHVGVGIGINTGLMCVGDMGSDIHKSYTVIGDAVNLGARLEGLCKIYGVDVIASESTKGQAPDWYWQELGMVRVKGKAQPVAIFHPLALRESAVRSDIQSVATIEKELSDWNVCLQHYRQQHWDACMKLLLQLQLHHPDKHLYRFYMDEVRRLQVLPPQPTWDAVTNFDTK